MLRSAVRIGAEVALAHKLKGISRLCTGKRIIKLAAGKHGEGIWVKIIRKGGNALLVAGIRCVEKTVVKAQLGVKAVVCAYPVEGTFYLSAVRRFASEASGS